MSSNISAEGASGVEPLLEVKNLRVGFETSGGIVDAVDGVSFSLERGKTTAVLGESGSGKTLTALALMGLTGPRTRVAGSAHFSGTDLLSLSPTGWRRFRGTRLAMIFQDVQTSLNPVVPVGRQIGEVLRVHARADWTAARLRAIELMDHVGIPAAAERYADYPHQFSGGMRQRILIAMALALSPELLIADEPTTALDVTVQAQIMRLLSDLRQETGMSLLLITHDLGVSADIADTIVVMYAGRIVEIGPAARLYARPAHPYTRALLESAPRLRSKGERLAAIAGAPPNPARRPNGCAFHPRCPLSFERCVAEVPTLRTLPGGERVACHRAEEVVGELA